MIMLLQWLVLTFTWNGNIAGSEMLTWQRHKLLSLNATEALRMLLPLGENWTAYGWNVPDLDEELWNWSNFRNTSLGSSALVDLLSRKTTYSRSAWNPGFEAKFEDFFILIRIGHTNANETHRLLSQDTVKWLVFMPTNTIV